MEMDSLPAMSECTLDDVYDVMCTFFLDYMAGDAIQFTVTTND